MDSLKNTDKKNSIISYDKVFIMNAKERVVSARGRLQSSVKKFSENSILIEPKFAWIGFINNNDLSNDKYFGQLNYSNGRYEGEIINGKKGSLLNHFNF
jgi:hypothetical protein